MRMHPTLLILLTLQLAACSSRGSGPRDPGSPTPVANPRSGQGGAGGGVSGPPATRHTDRRRQADRADQAPLVSIRDALEAESLLGRRVRVAGRCTALRKGRQAGSWTLDQAGASIEVRGLVPSSCTAQQPAQVTIFAQIEPKANGSRDRILLRLPD